MPARDRRLNRAYLALVALALIWGETWIVVGFAGRDGSPFFIAAIRAAVGALVLFAVLLVLRMPLRPTPVRDTAIFGLLQTTGWIGLQTVAVVLGGAGKTALLAYTMPFWIVLLAWPLLGERLTPLRWAALGLAAAGLACIVLPLRGGAVVADACAVGAGLAWGAATVWSKRMQRRGAEFDVLRLTAWQMLWGAIPLVVLALAVPEHVRWTASFVASMAFLVTIAQAAAWVLWLFIVSRLPAGVAGIASLATPVLAVALAAVQLHEIPTQQELAGAALLVAALIVNVRAYRGSEANARGMKRTIALAALLAAMLPFPARAQDEALVAAARRDGSLVLYSSVSLEDTTKLVRRFEQRYGIAVHVLRMESNQLPSRITIEARAGQNAADVALSPTLQMYGLKNAGLLERAAVPEARDFVPAAVDRDGYFGGVLINTDTIVYNPQRVAAAHLAPPHSWADLTRPEWRGKFGLFAHSYEWYLAMKKTLGSAAATALMRGLAANAPHLVSSHQLVIDQTVNGEYLAGANAFGYEAERLGREGRPIAFVNAPPTIAEVNAVGIVKGARHRSAALLFERWALSRDTQRFVVSVLGRSSGRKDVTGDPAIWNGKMQIVISDPSNAGDYQAAAREFDAIFGVR